MGYRDNGGYFDTADKFSWIPLLCLVIFFGAGIIIQIAAIKLVGGFLRAREAQEISEKYHKTGAFSFFGADTLTKFSTSSKAGVGGGSACLCFGLIIFFGSFGLFFSVLRSIYRCCLFRKLYESDCACVRPPTFGRERFQFCF